LTIILELFMADHWCSSPFGDPQTSPNLRDILERSVARYIQCPEDNGRVAYPRVMIENCFDFMICMIDASEYPQKFSPPLLAQKLSVCVESNAVLMFVLSFTGPFQDFPTSL
jgi:hypothetical protein